MNETASRQPLWYWGVVALLMLVGAGALSTSGRMPSAILYNSASVQRDSDAERTVEEMAADFHQFRLEVSQLTPEQQEEVWQSLLDRTDSLAEETLFRFFSLPAGQQQHLVDRTIDRMEERRRMWQEAGWGRGGYGYGYGSWPVREVSGEDWNRPFAELNLEERLALRRDMWEDATPQAYAMRGEFTRLLTERRKERGIPEPIRRSG